MGQHSMPYTPRTAGSRRRRLAGNSAKILLAVCSSLLISFYMYLLMGYVNVRNRAGSRITHVFEAAAYGAMFIIAEVNDSNEILFTVLLPASIVLPIVRLAVLRHVWLWSLGSGPDADEDLDAPIRRDAAREAVDVPISHLPTAAATTAEEVRERLCQLIEYLGTGLEPEMAFDIEQLVTHYFPAAVREFTENRDDGPEPLMELEEQLGLLDKEAQSLRARLDERRQVDVTTYGHLLRAKFGTLETSLLDAAVEEARAKRPVHDNSVTVDPTIYLP